MTIAPITHSAGQLSARVPTPVQNPAPKPPTPAPKRWKQEICKSIRTIDQLRQVIKLTKEEEGQLPEILKTYQMAITPYYARLINPNDPNDPIRHLVVPNVAEGKEDQGYFDTSGEEDNIKVNGLQHKYRSTALLLPTPVCASYCRYCFRKRFTTGKLAKQETNVDWENAFEYIKEHTEVDNVLITGGDPLILPNEKLDYILTSLRAIGHIKAIRIGTKFPAFNPFRISDEGFLQLLRKHSLPDRRVYIVSHFDHPRELTSESFDCIERATKAGAHWINQAVLHKGINDNPVTLRQLFRKLADAGVVPYYLFQLRPVKGSLQHRVPIKQGIRIFNDARKGLSGLAKQVRYVMSHYTGKIEIVGTSRTQDAGGRREEMLILRYLSCRDEHNVGETFLVLMNDNGCWLEDFMETEEHTAASKSPFLTSVPLEIEDV